MKRLGQVFSSLLAVALTVFSLQAMAESQLGGRDFNHMTTGFPLSGGHAAAACETCHTGGVFKGTPRNCDGCHVTGKRIVATPKSNSHIVTDAPCESCHFNTATWQGARFNHGTAITGQCTTCHNGRIYKGKPASHNTGSKATKSCDSCHRTSAWLPASWNHVGVLPGTCVTCHNGSTALGKTASHSGAKGTLACDDCHRMTGWLPAAFSHRNVLPGTCVNCHNGSLSTGKTGSHTGLKGTLACDSCHRTSAWLPASFNHSTVVGTSCASCHDGVQARGKTGTHVAPALKGTNACDDCHVNTAWLPARFKHNTGGTCSSCHNGSIAGGKTPSHVATADECSQCHIGNSAWKPALGGKPANHIPYDAGAACTSCHTGLAKVNANLLHTYTNSYKCYICHGKNTAYPNNNQTTASWPNYHESKKNSAAGDCSASGCHRPVGSKGSLYSKWD